AARIEPPAVGRPDRDLLRQRHGRIILRRPEERAGPSYPVSDPPTRHQRHCAIHRTPIQFKTTPLGTRLQDPKRGQRRVPEPPARRLKLANSELSGKRAAPQSPPSGTAPPHRPGNVNAWPGYSCKTSRSAKPSTTSPSTSDSAAVRTTASHCRCRWPPGSYARPPTTSSPLSTNSPRNILTPKSP